MSQPVRAGRVAVIAGLMAALYVGALFTVKTVPDWAIGLFGGPERPIDRRGGLTVTFRPAPGTERAFDAYLAEHGEVVRRGDGVLMLEFPGLPEDAALDTIDLMTSGGLVMKEVVETRYAVEIGAGDGVELEVDQWRSDDGGPLHTDPYLVAYSAEALAQHLDAAFARGVQLPPNTELAYEWIVPYPGAKDPRPSLRTYLVSTDVAIDGSMIASAVKSYDPNTNRPIVLLDFTEAGGDKFCELTGRIAGQKLATILTGRVESAPIINGRICGGRASITMGGSDPMEQEREANALVAVLATGALPAGGTVEHQAWKPAADVAKETWLARALFGLVAGIAFGVIVLFAVRFARPVRTAVPSADGAFPWRRLAVTALAPLVMFVGSYVTLPGINDVALAPVLRRDVGHGESVFALGITPIVTGFLIVELVALAVPRLRWRRHDALGRVRLGQAAAVLGIAFTLAQGYFLATYLESLSRFGVEVIVGRPGLELRLFLMISLAAGTMLLVLVAGLIREHGLGNGYAALLVTGWVFELTRPYLVEGLENVHLYIDRGTLVGLIGALVVALATRALLRWRVDGLRLPVSGISPLGESGGIVLLIVTLTSFGFGEALWGAIDRANRFLAGAPVNVVILIASVPLWAWLFARPRVTERVALQGGVDRTTPTAWLRATLVTLVFLGAAGALGIFTSRANELAYALMRPLSVMVATAALLDILDDARARRRKLVPAGVVHQVQYLRVLERVLADAAIPAHFHASHIRTLFAFFGPWAPIVVLVPEEHGEAARAKVVGVLTAARHEVAPAVARDARPTPERRSAPASDQTT